MLFHRVIIIKHLIHVFLIIKICMDIYISFFIYLKKRSTNLYYFECLNKGIDTNKQAHQKSVIFAIIGIF